MNVIHVCGGLGNQMFQYAFGRAMKSYGIPVRYDITWYNKPHGDRPYVLNKFNTITDTGAFLWKQDIIRENGLDPGLVQKNGYNFHGYWQSPKYHERVISDLKQEFTVKEKFYTSKFLKLREKIVKENSVAVHVRRGDFLAHHRHQVTSLEYYQRAISLMSTLKDNLVFYMFSDDPTWCKENFKDITFVHQEEYLDFELVRLCKHHIMPNSTFSLWAAYLNGDGINIAPTQWDKYPVDQELRVKTKCLLPDSWIKLENV